MPANDLAAKVRDLRTERSWSQDHLAAAAGVSLRTVQRVEGGYACAADTLMALAAAFGISAAELTSLVPASTNDGRVLGLTARQAAWIGLVLALPAAIFVAANLVNELWGPAWAAWYVDNAARNALTGGPLLIAGPVVGLLLNLVQIVRFDIRRTGEGVVVDRLQLRLQIAPVLLVAATGACLAVLGGYLVLENLGHLVAGIADR